MRFRYKFLVAIFIVDFFLMIVVDWRANLILLMVSAILTLAVLVLRGFRLMRAIYVFLGIFFVLTVYMLLLFVLQKGYIDIGLTSLSRVIQWITA